jgi:hypothetical protein
MSFPLSPSNGATTVVNGITYQYVSTQTAWYRVSSPITVAVPASISNALTIANTTNSYSTTTGALIVAGGHSLGGNLFVGGTSTHIGTSFFNGVTATNITATSVTIAGVAASSTVTGALQVIGGVGVNGNLYAGNIYTNNAQILPTSIQEFVSVQGQTIYSVSGGFSAGQVLVFANGLGLSSADYTAATPVITLNTQRNAGDIIKVVVGQQFAVPITQVSAAAAMAMVLGI